MPGVGVGGEAWYDIQKGGRCVIAPRVWRYILVGGEGVLLEDDPFGRGVGGLVADDASVCADLAERGVLLVVIAGADEVNDGIMEEFVGGVLSFSWSGEKGEYYL